MIEYLREVNPRLTKMVSESVSMELENWADGCSDSSSDRGCWKLIAMIIACVIVGRSRRISKMGDVAIPVICCNSEMHLLMKSVRN
jgi:hypothetical protein